MPMNAMRDINSYLETIREALDQSAIVAITDSGGTIIEVNDRFCEISKYSREELIGQNHRIINSGYHPRDFFVDMWRTIRSGNKWEGEVRNRAKDGSFYWVHTHIIPFRDKNGDIKEFVSIRYDVTSRKRAEENLGSLLDSFMDGLLIYDLSGNVCWSNRTAREMFSDVVRLDEQSMEFLLGDEFKIFQLGEARITKGYGDSARYYELLTKNYNFNNRAAYLVSLRDISEKVRAEAHAKHQDRLASIGVMASGLAHEIGTPLGVIRGRAEIIGSTQGVSEGIKKGADIIMQQIDRVSFLVKNLLKLARGEESQDLQPIHLASFFSDIEDFLHHELDKQNVTLDVKLDESFEVRAVYTSLFQIFLNLLINGMHAIAEKRKKREGMALMGVISITAINTDKHTIITVSDNGCGMTPDQLKKLFTPFFTTKDVGQGTGLGLATSYKLLEAWGGFFTVSSVPEQGSAFEVHFPRKEGL